MLHLTQIMIADEDTLFTQLVCQALRPADGFSVTGVYTSGAGLVDTVRRDRPDVLLIDLMLPGANTLAILRELNTLPNRPYIFVVSSFASAETSAECNRLGVNFFLRKPVSMEALVDLIRTYSAASHASTAFAGAEPTTYDISRHTEEILSSLHLPAHCKGYTYVCDGILLALQDPTLTRSVTKLLYPTIAKRNNTSWVCVERDIRNAIALAWNRSGGSFQGFHFSRRPVNREFILTVANRVRYELHLTGGAAAPAPRHGNFG